jgi:hypothetical protein
VQSRGALPFFTRFNVASPVSLPAQPAQSLLAAASGGRMLSELAPVMATTLPLIPSMTFCLLPSTFHFRISQRLARAARRFRWLSTVD